MVFSSLDLMLHTEALLSTMDFLSAALSNSSLPSPERESKKSEDMRTTSAKSSKHTHAIAETDKHGPFAHDLGMN